MKNKTTFLTFLAFLFVTPAVSQSVNKSIDDRHGGEWTESELNFVKEQLGQIRHKKWSGAPYKTSSTISKTGNEFLNWYSLYHSNSKARFEDYNDFLSQDLIWPNQSLFKVRVESNLSHKLSNDDIHFWFIKNPPKTRSGLDLFVKILLKKNDTEKIKKIVQDYWIKHNFKRKEQKSFLKKYRKYLSFKSHQQRADRLLWENKKRQAQRMLQFLGKDYKKVVQARLKLSGRHKNVQSDVNRIPGKYLQDEGVLYDRLKWRRHKKLYDGAIQILLNPPSAILHDKKWWKERDFFIRHYIAKKNYKLAYKLVNSHRQKKGLGLAEAEFLGGWLSLRYLNDAEQALGHFSKFFQSVKTPISKAKAAYWIARTYKQKDNKKEAENWYHISSQWPTTFYGQLSSYSLDSQKPLEFKSNVSFSLEELKQYRKKSFVQILYMLSKINEKKLFDKFYYHLLNSIKSSHEYEMLATIVQELNRKDLVVWTSRIASLNHVFLLKHGYPILDDNYFVEGTNTYLVHGLIRQESGFNQHAVSRAGALGYMQLMPKTARYLSKKLKIPFRKSKITDKEYNLKLGSYYIKRQIDRNKGSLILALISYNAGPSRVDHWISKFGDPRQSSVDVIDWIEKVPFSETRGYIHRVLENAQIYKFIMGNEPTGNDLYLDLRAYKP